MLDAGLDARFERVESEAELRQALAAFQPDIVLSDLSMPGFSGDDALRIVRETAPEVPFIFVSGTMGERRGGGAAERRQRLHHQAPAVGGGACDPRCPQRRRARTGGDRTDARAAPGKPVAARRRPQP